MLSHLSDRWLAIAVAGFAIGVALWPIAFGLEPTVDDGFYYLETARHLAAGDGSTFDGLHTTNGYHPLWLLVLVLVYWTVPEQAMALELANLLQAILATTAAVLVYATARSFSGRLTATLAAVLWIDLTYRYWLSGLELSIHAVCLLGAVQLYLSRHAERPAVRTGAFWVVGVVCALTFLSRLDAFLLPIVLAPALGLWSRRGRVQFAAFAMPVLIACCAYVAFNSTIFGHPFSVSAAVKQGWSEVLLGTDPVYLDHGWVAAKARHLVQPFIEFPTSGEARPLALGIAGAGFWCLVMLGVGARSSWRQGFLERRRLLAPMVCYCVLQFLAYALIYHGVQSYRPWYFVCQPWLGVVVVGSLVESMKRQTNGSRRWLRRWTMAVVMLCCLIAAHTVRGLMIWNETHRPSPFRQTAEWASDHLPTEAVIGAWNAGTLGYWSSRPVVNLDGLVNSWEFFERRQFDLCRYWSETGITHIIDAFSNEQFLTLLPTYPQYEHCADRLHLLIANDGYSEAWSIRVFSYGDPPAEDSGSTR